MDDIRLEAVTRRFGAVEALHAIDLRVGPREVVVVVGPSGCGKSTLLELVCGLQRPTSGRVEAGRAVLMPQRDGLLPWFDALGNAALPLRIAGASKAEARTRAHPVMAELGLEGFERARPAQLSGGMRQRVAFARTLLAGAPILCLDEPFGALDAITRAQTQAWLAGALAAESRTVLLVTHDVEEAAMLGDRIVVLSPRPGRITTEVAVDVPRPRSPTDPAVVEARFAVLASLGLVPA